MRRSPARTVGAVKYCEHHVPLVVLVGDQGVGHAERHQHADHPGDVLERSAPVHPRLLGGIHAPASSVVAGSIRSMSAAIGLLQHLRGRDGARAQAPPVQRRLVGRRRPSGTAWRHAAPGSAESPWPVPGRRCCCPPSSCTAARAARTPAAAAWPPRPAGEVSEKTPSMRLEDSWVSAPWTFGRTTASTAALPLASQSRRSPAGSSPAWVLPAMTAILCPHVDWSAMLRSSGLPFADDQRGPGRPVGDHVQHLEPLGGRATCWWR